MRQYRYIIQKKAYVVVAAVLAAIGVLPLLTNTSAMAYGQPTSRSIQMSDSTPSASSVSYLVTFTPATTATTIQAVAVDFCSNDPIIGDSCTAPTTFSVGTPTISGFSITGESGGTWTATASHSSRTLEISNGSATGTPSGSATFTLTTATNPSTTGTFYARIFTFSSTANLTTWDGTANGSATATVLDAGGVALSTANVISITAKVQETLTFCVSKLAPGPTCGTTGQVVTTPTLTLGSGSPATLDTNAVDTDTAYTQISSNAASGVVVALKVTSSTTCAGLSKNSGSTCGIPAIGSFAAISAGTADFGLNVADGSGGTGSVTHNANYGTTAGSYGMRTQTFGTYGDAIESSSAPTASVNSLLTYGATASTTTSAGIYTTTEALIATGTF